MEADISVIAQRLAQVYPKNYPKKFTVKVVSWVDSLVGQFRRTLYTLAAAVGLLLLIACTNVANMLLARATAREREMAIRSSLGASRTRLVRQLLIESFLLALAGAAVGCLFAHFGIKALVTAIPDGLVPREAVIQLNVPVLLFSLGVAISTAVVFGLAPALQTAKRNLVDALKASGRGVTDSFRRGKLRSALVVVEVALSLVLLAGAGLLMRSFVKLQTVDLGLKPDNILVARCPCPEGSTRPQPQSGSSSGKCSPASRVARSAGSDRNQLVATVRRHRQRYRHPGQDAPGQVECYFPVVQRRISPDPRTPSGEWVLSDRG